MIDIRYDRYLNNTTIVCKDMSNISEQLPIQIKLKNIITNEIHYEVKLRSGTWASWNGAELITDVLVYSSNGKLLKKYPWDVTIYGDEIEKTLYYYHLGRIASGKYSNGLVLGTHDGRNGHWIYSVKDRLTKATLVDGSKNQFEKLKENYKNSTHVRLINSIVTTDGSDVEWYQGGEGYTDTIVPELIYEWLDSSEITKVRKKSISINELMSQEEYDWLHLDVEGIDADLILSLEKRPNIIIYESMNLNEQKQSELNYWFEKNLYKTLTTNGNTIAIKESE